MGVQWEFNRKCNGSETEELWSHDNVEKWKKWYVANGGVSDGKKTCC